eukprot:TRINITY_DN45458_c0_g1_i1.p1 TRINITY_DN45458_c0_g1~~TRINITY_DN45458_c0_g1_i1.p1  ORF type:complete len:681 (-),score=84.24 TRINITY_DN45458_c0_g1_i1:363-2405(-)
MGSGVTKKAAPARAPVAAVLLHPDVAEDVLDSPKDTPRVERKRSRNSVVLSAEQSIPEYWYHKKTAEGGNFDDMYYVNQTEHSTFDELFRETYVAKATQDRPCPDGKHGRTPGGCPCVQPGANPGMPVAFRVRRVIRVEASDMWTRYHNKKKTIASRRSDADIVLFDPPELTRKVATSHEGIFAPLDSGLNEVYAFHGTRVRYALSIAQHDFNIDLAGSSRGTLYGRGAYLGESISKADEYARDEPGGYYDGVFAVLVCRVTMGKLHCTSDDPEAGSKVASGHFDSTCGTRLFRELVIYDADQLYPEYVVLYQRVYPKDVEEDISRILRRRFFMEVPLHWMNVATDLKTGFQEEHSLPEKSVKFFQSLVNQALDKETWELHTAVRLEASSLWKKYVACQARFRKRLGGPEGKSATEGCPDLEVSHVEQDIRALTRRPCKFFAGKRGCRNGDKCRFSHNRFAKDLGEEGLAAGRRLPVDELDGRLNEAFLWLCCTLDEAKSMRDGEPLPKHSRGDAMPEGTCLFESLDAALRDAVSTDGLIYAVMCRVICGVPTEDISKTVEPPDCALVVAEAKSRREVVIWEQDQVYPEYLLELQAPEEELVPAEPSAAEGSEDGYASKHSDGAPLRPPLATDESLLPPRPGLASEKSDDEIVLPIPFPGLESGASEVLPVLPDESVTCK